MKHKRILWLAGMVLLVTILSACHLEQGKLFFDKVGLDPITVYNMAPLERTVYCLAEIKEDVGPAFEIMHAKALAEVRNDPEQADWSELVCLSLSGEASPWQLEQTVDTLDRVLALQSKQHNSLGGFQRILQVRLNLYEQIEKQSLQIEQLRKEQAKQIADADRAAKRHEQLTNELQNRINELEQQVRKLKEVELLLHPKS